MPTGISAGIRKLVPYAEPHDDRPPGPWLKQRDKRIIIGLTSRGNDIYYGTMLFLMKQMMTLNNPKLFVSVSSHAVEQEDLFEACKGESFDYIYILDSDVEPHRDTLVTLLSSELDFVGSPVWIYTPSEQLMSLNATVPYGRVFEPKESGVEEVDAISSSLIISKKVFDAFETAGEKFTKWSPLIKNVEESVTADQVLCAKAQALGFKVHVSWDCKPAAHHKYVCIEQKLLETTFRFVRRDQWLNKNGRLPHPTKPVSRKFFLNRFTT